MLTPYRPLQSASTWEEDAVDAILTGKILPGDVVIVRYEGPKGGPGMREMLTPTAAICGAGLDKTVALITDGRFSGATAARQSDMSLPRLPRAAKSLCFRTAISLKSISPSAP